MKAFSRTSSVVTGKEGYYDNITDRSTKRRWIGLLFSFTNAWQLQRKTKRQGKDEEEGPSPFHPEGRNLELEQTVRQSPASSIMARDSAFLELLRSLFGKDSAVEQAEPDTEHELLSQCQDWYLRFIDSWIEAAQGPLLEGVLGNSIRFKRTPTGQSVVGEAEKTQLYTLMSLIIREMCMRERKGLALTEIVTTLQEQGSLEITDASREYRDIQMVFTLVGWLTMLYEPVPNPESNKLQLEQPNAKRKLRLRRNDVIHTFSLNIVSPEQCVSITQQPLHRLLHRFGSLIPRPDDICDSWELMSGSATQAVSYWGSDSALDSSITVHHVCFHTLQKIIEVKIQWVETLNQHLEFDPGKKTLKLFRYPAFCWMMCRNAGFDTFSSRLFEEKWSEDDELSSLSPRADDFFREVLLSYRLIFGQDKRSRNAYRKHAAKRDRGNERGMHECRQHPEDPLLALLCGQSWRSSKSRTIYQSIDLDEEVSKIYLVTDFPFLGKRLLQLQRFSKCQYPHGWIMLWHDRRNLPEWWTIWAVLFIGGGTIIVALFTLAFQILQVYA